MAPDVLTTRELNRATLERQLLLRRHDLGALDAVQHLVGLQAQEPRDPYLALWSRLDGFRPDDLERLLLDREVVRIVVMRGTIHLVTGDDALAIAPLVRPILDAELARHRDFAPALAGVDLQPMLRAGKQLLAAEPLSTRKLRAAMAERFPAVDAGALAYACRNHLALVQVPPRGCWRESSEVTLTTAESWLGRPLVKKPSIDELALRYFAAFGPASPADLAAWSRLTGMREVVDRLGSRLRAFRTEAGKEVYDLPDAPRPEADVPAPPRFLPEYDNVVLSHADRGRFAWDTEDDLTLAHDRGFKGSVLADGRVAATWRLEPTKADARTLVVDHVATAPKRLLSSITAEARRVMAFLTDGASNDVRLEPVG